MDIKNHQHKPNLVGDSLELDENLNKKPKIKEICKWFFYQQKSGTSTNPPLKALKWSDLFKRVKQIPEYDPFSKDSRRGIMQSPVQLFIYEDESRQTWKHDRYLFKNGEILVDMLRYK